MSRAQMTRNVVFVLLGVAVLVLKPTIAGSDEGLTYAHAGNVSVSFALYFVALIAVTRRGSFSAMTTRLVAAALALLAVELFELMDGFGVMENVYDPWDLVANAVGVGLGVVADMATAPFVRREPDAPGEKGRSV